MKKNKKVKKQNEGADYFTALVKSDLKLEIVKEHRFHPVRRFRFDYAIPSYKIAIEVEGGVWTNGRHTRGKGFLGDVEKYNQATVLGWRLIRCTPDTLTKSDTLSLISELVKYIDNQLVK